MTVQKIRNTPSKVNKMFDALKVTVKDYNILVDAFNEIVDSTGNATIAEINEKVAGAGVTIEKVLLKDGNIDMKGTALVEHGAGAIGTAFAPRTYRWTESGHIITEIHVDLTGLDSAGAANDVIGLSSGGAAYIGRNVVATNGIIYKVEMTCLEVPTAGDADVILVAGATGTHAFDAAVGTPTTICDGTGDWALGETITYTSGITANHYFYLTQGSTDDATYTAGQFIIRLYGHAVLV